MTSAELKSLLLDHHFMITQKDRDEIEAIVDASETKQIMNEPANINPGEGYRLLTIGEELEPTDEFWQPGEVWIMHGQGAARCSLHKHHYAHRRRLQTKPASQWIPISERPPEFPCFILRNGSPCFYNAVIPATVTDWTEQQKAGATHWMPFVAPDPKPDDEAECSKALEIAWQKFESDNADLKQNVSQPNFECGFEVGFLAGLALGRKEK